MAYISVDDVRTERPIPWLPFAAKLRDGTPVRLIRVRVSQNESQPLSNNNRNSNTGESDASLVVAMQQLLNYELVIRGDSYPFGPQELTLPQFRQYYCAYDTFALVRDGSRRKCASAGYEFGDRLIGCFYIKPNYPHRSAHICNAGFLVVPKYQNGRGAGELMAVAFIKLAVELGYAASIFNLVYDTNKGSIRLWEKLGFRRISTIPAAGKLKANPGKGPHGADETTHLVDAHQYHGELPKLLPMAEKALLALQASAADGSTAAASSSQKQVPVATAPVKSRL